MKKTWIVAGVVLAVLAVSASAIAISSKKPISHKTTLTFELQGVAGENLDLGVAGESLGDQFVSSSLLLKNSSKVGRIDSVCSITNLSPTTTVCHAGLRLDEGQIELLGRVPGNALSGQANIKIAVAGGTGAYRHSHGFATVDTTDSILTIVLTP